MGIARLESFLCCEDVQEAVQVSFRCLDLLEMPLRELEMWAAVERPPVMCVVTGEWWCSWR